MKSFPNLLTSISAISPTIDTFTALPKSLGSLLQVADFVGPTTPLSAQPASPLVVPPDHLQLPYLPALPVTPTLETSASHTSYRRTDDYSRAREYDKMGEYTPNSDYDYQGMRNQKNRLN